MSADNFITMLWIAIVLIAFGAGIIGLKASKKHAKNKHDFVH